MVLIRSGTYKEALTPIHSGVEGRPVTFRRYTTEAVFLSGGPAINLSNRRYIILDGFRVDNTTWLEAVNAHYNVVRNCSFTRTPASGTTGNVRLISSTHNQLLNNVFEQGSDNLALIDCQRNVVQGNTFREGRHSLLTLRCSSLNVIRSNYFENSLQKCCEVYDCGAVTRVVPNAFNATRRNLIEDNVFAGTSSYYSTSGGNGLQYSGQQGIIRRNVMYRCNVGLGMQTYADEALYNTTNRIYHNVFYRNEGAGIATRSSNTNNIYKNNILLGNKGCVGNCDTGASAGQIVYRESLGRASYFENNDLVNQKAGEAVIEEEFGRGMSASQYELAHRKVLVGTLELDPQFRDAARHDFRLLDTSPLIDAGAFLTQTSAAGAGTNLAVQDVHSFYDGFGIAGEVGDEIQLRGQTETARVLRIDAARHTLVLDRALEWEAGQGVALRFNGRGPDIGAFESPPPPVRFGISGGPSAVVVSWSSDDARFHLEASSTLTNPEWTNAEPPRVTGEQWSVTNTPVGTARFFRMVK
jgi:hypothetical protein